MSKRPVHPDFLLLLHNKNPELVELYLGLRQYILELFPDCNEMLYHTHALTSVYSVSDKLSDAFCMLPIYNNHLNLGFNKGTVLKDPNHLLTGTGNLIRHIDVKKITDIKNAKVKALLTEAHQLALRDLEGPQKKIGLTISKIKPK